MRKISYACMCHVGRVRKVNQDNYSCAGLYRHIDKETRIYPLTGTVSTGRCAVFGVFDGLGGEQRGEVSSYLAASLAAHGKWGRRIKNDLKAFCNKANRAICDFAEEEGLRATGTTAAMLVFRGRKLFLCNLGDSRIFRLSKGRLIRISKDHIEPGAHGAKPALSQCLGIPPEEFLIAPYITRVSSRKGDRFLICSDGVTDMLNEADIAKYSVEKSVKKAAKKLMSQSLEKGGRDNTTLILIEVIK